MFNYRLAFGIGVVCLAVGAAGLTAIMAGLSTALLVVLAMTAALDWVCTAILLRASLSHRDSMALAERAGAALLLAVAITSYMLVGINSELDFPWFDLDTTRIFNRLVLTVIGIIPARWLYLYWRGRFK